MRIKVYQFYSKFEAPHCGSRRATTLYRTKRVIKRTHETSKRTILKLISVNFLLIRRHMLPNGQTCDATERSLVEHDFAIHFILFQLLCYSDCTAQSFNCPKTSRSFVELNRSTKGRLNVKRHSSSRHSRDSRVFGTWLIRMIIRINHRIISSIESEIIMS